MKKLKSLVKKILLKFMPSIIWGVLLPLAILVWIYLAVEAK